MYKQEVKAVMSPMVRGNACDSPDLVHQKNGRESTMLPPSSAAYRQPAINSLPSRRKQIPLSPLSRRPLLKSQSLPLLSPIEFMTRSRTNGESEATYSSSPRTCSGRCQWRSLLDSPSTFGREHGSCFRPEHHRPSFKDAYSGRIHPYARSSSVGLERRSESLSRNGSHPMSSTRVEDGYSAFDTHDKYRYRRPSNWDAELSPQGMRSPTYQPGESQREYLPAYDHNLALTSYGSPGSRYALTDESHTSRYAHPRAYQYRWSVPHEDIYDRYKLSMGDSRKGSAYSYPPGYASSMSSLGSISPDNAQGNCPESYWRRGLSYDEDYARKMKGEQEDARNGRDPSYAYEGHEQANDTNIKMSSINSNSAESTPAPKRGGKLPKHITDMLKSWLLEHAEHPYPTEDEKLDFCDRTGLDICQISNWFVNARRRILIPQQRPAAAASQST